MEKDINEGPIATDEEALKPQPTIKYEHVINGKQVTFRRRVPNKIARNLFELASDMANITQDTNKMIPLGMALIESWEFDGSPQEAASYDELDFFDEIVPLAYALGEYATTRMQAAGLVKN